MALAPLYTVKSSTLYQAPDTQIIDGRPVRYRDVCVHEIRMADVEDPEIYLAEPLIQWQNSDQGQWLMEHAEQTPYWLQNCNYSSYQVEYRIFARLSEHNETYWRLRWGGRNK